MYKTTTTFFNALHTEDDTSGLLYAGFDLAQGTGLNITEIQVVEMEMMKVCGYLHLFNPSSHFL
jgi:hypothetical protein